MTLMGERRATEPWGLQGGGPGARGEDPSASGAVRAELAAAPGPEARTG